MSIWKPKRKSKRNSFLRSLGTAWECEKPIGPAKWASKLWVPPLLRLQSLGFPCCCDETGCQCMSCGTAVADLDATVVLAGFGNDTCNLCTSMNDTFVIPYDALASSGACADDDAACRCEYSDEFYVSDSDCITKLQVSLVVLYYCADGGHASAGKTLLDITVAAFGPADALLGSTRFGYTNTPYDGAVSCSGIASISFPNWHSYYASSECDGSSATASASLA